jgi:uncharacterized membrane protein (DUF373 family)
MLKTVDKIESLIVIVLVFLLLATVIMGVLELASVVILEIIDPPYFRIEIPRLFEMFSLFLIVLIGLELLRTVKSYLAHGEIRPEIVIEAAIIAMGNKLITLDIKLATPGELVGLAGILVGLAALYFVVKKMAKPIPQ